MSRFLLLNFEDFSLNQDLTKTIQPFNPFCICCLDRVGPMFDLEKCDHSDYLDAFDFDKPELKQFNQHVCLHCHSILKKIKHFQAQVSESYSILRSGEFTNTTVNNKKLNNLIVQKVVDDLHLPPDMDMDIENNQKDLNNVQNEPYKGQSYKMGTVEEVSNIKQNFTQEIDNVLQKSNMEPNFSQEISDVVQDSNMEQSFTQEIDNVVQDSNMEQNFTHKMSDLEQNSNIEPFTNLEENLDHEQHKLNKNIKTALEILERNNQSFVSLSSQLQFLNGEHLSFLEPSLLSKEILTDLPLVPAKSLRTDLENGLLNNSKLEIDIGPDKMFYDSLDLSPELGKETNASEIMDVMPDARTQKEIESTTKTGATKLKGTKVQKPKSLQIRRIKLTHEELDRERVMQAQSDAYLRYKFRCQTCIVSFNYKENLEDHMKRKHGLREGDGVICPICSQLIPNAGSVTEHNYRHYTRYECIQCNKRYHSQDEVTRHYTNHQSTKNISEKKTFKNKSTTQLKRAKLKMRPTKV